MKKILAILFGALVIPASAEFWAPPAFFYEQEEIVEEVAPEAVHAPVTAQPHANVPSPRNQPRAAVGHANTHRAATTQMRGAGVRQAAPQAGTAAPRAIQNRAAPAQANRGAAPTTNVSRAAVTGQVRAPAPQQGANRAPTAARPIANRAPTTQGRAAATSRATAPMVHSMENVPAAQAHQAAAPTAGTQARVAATPEINTARAVSLTGPAMTSARGAATTRSAGTPTLFNATAQPAPADIVDVISEAEQAAALMSFCRAQYMECMDNFCNVLDDNQGRCSCSPNVERYADAERALQEANIALQQVAVDIRYLGLTRDEVEALFRETEAEEAMRLGNDNSQIRHTLDAIQGWLIDPTQITTTSSGISNMFDFSSLDFGGGLDIGALFNNNSTESVLSQRGQALFDTATDRCRPVLDNCRRQGVDTNAIRLFYDLEIDRQCVAYERHLDDANTNMRATIRNATNVLQQARLMVAQNRNRLDLRGCISALDTCMRDEFVCGPNYRNCLDTTGDHFVSGELVRGSRPSDIGNGTVGRGEAWSYDEGGDVRSVLGNIASTAGSISAMVNNLVGAHDFETSLISGSAPAGNNNLAFLLANRIGFIDDQGRPQGMCSSVLAQCQNHTFSNNSYLHNNEVVREFLNRTLMQIRARQDEIISSYAASCRQDVLNCMSRNNMNQNANTAARSCQADLTTCFNVLGTSEVVGLGGICSSGQILRRTLNDTSDWECCENMGRTDATPIACFGCSGNHDCPNIGEVCNIINITGVCQ